MSRRVERTSAVGATLARNRLGVVRIVFFVVAAAAPLTVVSVAVSTGYAVSGFVGIPAAYVAVALILGVFAAGFVAMSRHVVNSGAFYSYIARGLGRPAGVGAAFVALLAYNLMEIGLLGGFGAAASFGLGRVFGLDVGWFGCALAAWAAVGVLGVLRVDVGGWFVAAVLACEVVFALVCDTALIAQPVGGVWDLAPLSPGVLASGLGAAACVGAIGSFTGIESTVVYAEESKDPRRTVARATYAAIVITGGVYALSSWALELGTGVNHIAEQAGAHGTELLFDLVSPQLGERAVLLGRLLLASSLFAGALAFHNVVARYSFALGRERVLPGWLGRVGRNGAPRWGSLVQTGLALVALVAAWYLHADPMVNVMFWLTVLGGFGVVLLMAATSVSVVVFFRRDRRGVGWWSRLGAPIVAALLLTLVALASLTAFDVLLGVDAASPLRWWLPALFAIAAVVGLVWALVLRQARPGVYAAVGLGADSARANIPTPRMAAHGVATVAPAQRAHEQAQAGPTPPTTAAASVGASRGTAGATTGAEQGRATGEVAGSDLPRRW